MGTFAKKSQEEQKAFIKKTNKADKKQVIKAPTPAPTFLTEKKCSNGPFTVSSGWAGAGYGDNYCNLLQDHPHLPPPLRAQWSAAPLRVQRSCQQVRLQLLRPFQQDLASIQRQA